VLKAPAGGMVQMQVGNSDVDRATGSALSQAPGGGDTPRVRARGSAPDAGEQFGGPIELGDAPIACGDITAAVATTTLAMAPVGQRPRVRPI
jgi:hypothetical protein